MEPHRELPSVTHEACYLVSSSRSPRWGWGVWGTFLVKIQRAPVSDGRGLGTDTPQGPCGNTSQDDPHGGGMEDDGVRGCVVNPQPFCLNHFVLTF